MADSIERPITPPPRTPTTLHTTPEHAREFEINRLRAKAAQREKESTAEASRNSLNSNRKRPINDMTTSPTGSFASSSSKALKRDSRLGTYFEYDLSKMVNSKAGFLLDDNTEVDEEVRRKEKEREKQRVQQNMEPPVYLDQSMNPRCQECKTIDIDHTYRKVFGCLVCRKCQNEKPEKYSLLTKTECKEVRPHQHPFGPNVSSHHKQDYLLTDPELRDQELLPHLLKANPHKSTYANMMLFLRYQVEEFAWKKWGNAEALDAEYQRRTEEKKKQKNKKFEQSLKELRRRTKESVWQRRKDEEHKHSFGPLERDSDGNSKQVCHVCGFTVAVEEL